MIVSNTQLAAALVVLEYKILPSTNYDHKEVVFDFEDRAEIESCKEQWRTMSSGAVMVVCSPLVMMYKASKARQWILDQVIHGDHNQGLTLPPTTMTTTDLDFAICLVAQGYYLLKLDKDQRVFHFDSGIEVERKRFHNPARRSNYDYQRRYLKTLSQLVRQINNRNKSGQPKPDTITCAQP